MSDRARRAAEELAQLLFPYLSVADGRTKSWLIELLFMKLARHFAEPAPPEPPQEYVEYDSAGYPHKVKGEAAEPNLTDLLEKARTHVMTSEEKAAQRQSWARGEAAMGESTVKAEPEAGAREALAVTCHTCGATYRVTNGVGELVEERAHRERVNSLLLDVEQLCAAIRKEV